LPAIIFLFQCVSTFKQLLKIHLFQIALPDATSTFAFIDFYAIVVSAYMYNYDDDDDDDDDDVQ